MAACDQPPTADERQAIVQDAQVGLDRGVGVRQLGEPAGFGIEQGEPVAAVLPVPAGDAPISHERIAGVVELPGGVGELSRHRQQRLHLAIAVAVQVPPPRPVRDEAEDALCSIPLGLHDGLRRAADDVPGWAQPPVRTEIGDPQVGAIPRHARPVPGYPGKAATIGTGTGGGVEVMPTSKHPRLGRPIGGKRHELVDHFATLMAFPHTNQQLSSPRNSQIAIA
jgi:hypothetical protein